MHRCCLPCRCRHPFLSRRVFGNLRTVRRYVLSGVRHPKQDAARQHESGCDSVHPAHAPVPLFLRFVRRFPAALQNSSGRGVYSAPGLFSSSGMGYSHSVFPRFIGVPLLTLSMVSGVHGSPYHLLWTSTWGYGHSTPSLRKPSSRSWFKIRFAANTFSR